MKKGKLRVPLAPLAIFLLIRVLGYGTEIVNNDITSNESHTGIELSTTDTLLNNGTISGGIDLVGGSTIADSDVTIADITNGVFGNVTENNGIIIGTSTLEGGTSAEVGATAEVSSTASSNGIHGNIITNNGIISGSQNLKGGASNNNSVLSLENANGVFGDVSENNGTISGIEKLNGNGSKALTNSSANGVFGAVSLNNGIISGNSNLSGDGTSVSLRSLVSAVISGNGISPNTAVDITNNGVISGNITAKGGGVKGKNAPEYITFSGNGISRHNVIDTDINNSGVIKGSQSAIAAAFITGAMNNYGILAGREIFGNGIEVIKNGTTETQKDLRKVALTTENNQGIYIKLKSETIGGNTTGKVVLNADGNPVIEEIEIGIGGNIGDKTIINGDLNGDISVAQTLVGDADTYLNSSNLITGEKVIINGSGIDEGALVIDSDTTLKDSIVNGYNTAIYLEGINKFTAENTIFNGGGLNNDVAVIKGDDGNNTLNIFGNSIINGSIEFDDGINNLTIGSNVKVNGDINGGNGKDTLNLGDSTLGVKGHNLNILHEINDFETINTSGNVTLFETAKVTGASNINIVNGDLILRVDPKVTDNGKVIGHALYENSGTLSSNGGNLVVGLNGIGVGTTIAMGKTTIAKNMDDSWWKSTDHIKTNSLVLDGKVSADGKDINITILESIPLIPINPDPKPDPKPDSKPDNTLKIDKLLYKKLNQGYQSIVNAGEIGKLSNTTLLENKTQNDSLGGLLRMLDQMYANNPYSYTLKSTRDNLKLFEENMSYLTIKPKKNEWIAQGKAIYTGVKNDNKTSEKKYYGFDTGHRNYKTTTDTAGGISTFEYGISDKTSVGGIVGGSNQNINFKGSSKTKANSLYLGTFAKTEVDNFRFSGGLGYQYTSADTDRKISNAYDSFKTSDKYNINSLNAFAEAKYVYQGTQNWSVEPKTRLSYYYIDQDKVDEGYKPGQLSIGVDQAKSKTADLEVGVDFVKSVYLEKSKLNNVFYAGVVNTLGNNTKDLKGHVIGKDKKGSNFDIQGTELPRTSGKVAYNLELEQDNGMIYTAGVNMKFSKDYNRTVNTFVGLGYKF